MSSQCKKCFSAQYVWVKKDETTKYLVRCKELGCDLEMVGENPVQAKGCPKAVAESGQKG
jgi:hypothetical protein